jgi:hypothetical protein
MSFMNSPHQPFSFIPPPPNKILGIFVCFIYGQYWDLYSRPHGLGLISMSQFPKYLLRFLSLSQSLSSKGQKRFVVVSRFSVTDPKYLR